MKCETSISDPCRSTVRHAALIMLCIVGLTAVAGCTRAESDRQRDIAEKQAQIANENLREAEAQRAIAEQNAEEADRQRILAERNAEEAVRQRKITAANINISHEQRDIATRQRMIAEDARRMAEAGYEIAREERKLLEAELEEYRRRLAQAKKDTDSLRTQVDLLSSQLKAAQQKIKDLRGV